MRKNRAYYEEMVKSPGKFEGEAPYVPYFWESYLNGGTEECANGDIKVEVIPHDRHIFPELKGVRCVRMRVSVHGFVSEV